MNLPDDLKFKPEDFSRSEMQRAFGENADWFYSRLAQIANALLAEKLGEVTTVYGNPNYPHSWGLSRTGWIDKPMTHTAYLVGVREL